VYGDIMVATRNGFLSINAIMQKQQETIEDLSKNIKKDWQYDVLNLQSNDVYKVANCNNSNLVFISLPTPLNTVYVFNLETGAWAKIKGWEVDSILITDCNLFFGGANGWVYRGDSGGFDDNDRLFEAKLCYNFLSFGVKAGFKNATRIKEIWAYNNDFISKASVATNYNIAFDNPPNVIQLQNFDGSDWDLATWDLANWASDENISLIRENWIGASGQGEVFAPTVQLSSAQPYKLDCQLIGIDLAYKQGKNIA
jgi:hypothetical protein